MSEQDPSYSDPIDHDSMLNDPKYAELIKELEYIAKEARRLFDPNEDSPSDKVWDEIQKGLSKPAND